MPDWQCPACQAHWIDKETAETRQLTWGDGEREDVCGECAAFYESAEAIAAGRILGAWVKMPSVEPKR